MKQRRIIAVLAMILVLVLAVGLFVACDKNNKPDNPTPNPDKTYAQISDEIYQAALGDFYSVYQKATAAKDTDERYALMALAEAKLLESGTFIPTSSQGGTFAMSRVAPNTVSPTLWGNDSERFHNVVVTDNFITIEHRNAMKAKYAELKGTGKYEEWAKAYLKEKGYTLKDTYTKAYTTDPVNWDILATNRSVDVQAIVNMVDGLIEYDCEGQPKGALAKNWNVSEDGLTYTFHLREGLAWADKDGNKYADLTATDFVDGLQRALDKNKTAYLVAGVIKNAAAYMAGEVEMSEVGVKAVDAHTVEYTLEEPCSYFLSMFNYNPLSPFCKAYAESVGEKYATSPEYIVSCGPYRVTNYTAKNKIVFSANPLYWNKEGINIKTLTWKCYSDNKDTTATYKAAINGDIDGAGLTATAYELAKNAHPDWIYVSATDATAFGFYVNINRAAYETIQGYGLESPQTEAQKAVTNKAFSNANFRMALARSIDKKTYNAQVVGDDAALYSLGNMYTPGSFVQLSKAVTVKINGKDTTFAKGTYYGAMVQAQLNADMGEDAMKVWDPTADEGLGSSSGFDGWYNVEVAKKYFAKALEELKAQGVEVSASNPIYVDYPFFERSDYTNRANALKKNIEAVFEGKVKVNIIGNPSPDPWQYAGYFCDTGSDCNYNIYDCSGWAPDFQDPSSFLDTMIPGGDMIHLLGIY